MLDMVHFNPLPPHGGRRENSVDETGRQHISIHSLRMEGDNPGCENPQIATDFNPLPPHGGRPRYSLVTGRYSSFQSTPSAWRETCSPLHSDRRLHISIHSLRMEGDSRETVVPPFPSTISIHSLRMEGDVKSSVRRRTERNFNPLPPHGGRLIIPTWYTRQETFQSTPSAWRETFITSNHYTPIRYFNPLPPHGGRPSAFL